jgi:dUTP pyrophosphatase
VTSVQVKRLRPDALVPTQAYPGDAGFDLTACERVELGPGERCVIGTGIAVAIPPGHAGLVVPRSGLAARHGLGKVNAPGLIDEGYRGEVKVILHNSGDSRYTVEIGDRVAQLLLVPFWAPEMCLVNELPASGDDRGAGGFGSSGVRPVERR